MNNRTKATSIPKKVREEVYARDKGCIKGIKENLVTLCILCHHEMDNGKNTIEVTQKVREYLEKLYPEVTDEMRKYNKWRNEK